MSRLNILEHENVQAVSIVTTNYEALQWKNRTFESKVAPFLFSNPWMKSYSVFEYYLATTRGYAYLFPLVIFYVDQSEPVY